MSEVIGMFSSREQSIIFWMMIVLGFFIYKNEIRRDLYAVFKTFFTSTNIVVVFSLFILYQATIVYLLTYLGVWNKSFLKDTILWFLSIGLVLFFTIHKAKKLGFFKSAIKESFRWTIIVEFVMNFYTFPLLVELITVPIVTLLILTQTFAEQVNKDEKVSATLTKLIQIIGYLVICFVVYKTINEYDKIFTFTNLQSIILPLIYIICFIPFLYALALYVQYEELFVRINCMVNDGEKKLEIKKAIARTATVNLNKVTLINEKFKKYDMYQSNDIQKYIKSLINSSAMGL